MVIQGHAGRAPSHPESDGTSAAGVRPTLGKLSSSVGEGRRRLHRVALTSVAALGGRTVSAVTLLASVPMTVGYLGASRFGILATITSIGALLGASDLGVGNGLVNAIAAADAHDDRSTVKHHVSNAFFGLGGLSLGLGALLVALALNISWGGLLGLSPPASEETIARALAAFVGITVAAIPFGIAQRVQSGYQEGYFAGAAGGGASLASLGLIALAVHLNASFVWVVLAVSSAPFIAGVLNTIVLFGFTRPWLRPSLSAVSSNGIRALAGVGGLFVVIQLIGVTAYQTDSIVLARVLGPAAVAEYTVALRLFGTVTLLIGFVLAPLWPAYREAIASGDSAWVRVTFRRSFILSAGVASLASAVLVVAGGDIVRAWASGAGIPGLQLLIAFGLWTVVASAGGALAMFFNGVGLIRFQVCCGIAMAVANLALSIVLTQRVGVAGVVWGSLIAQTGFVLVPSLVYLRRRTESTVLAGLGGTSLAIGSPTT